MNSTQFEQLALQVACLSVRQRRRILALRSRTSNHDKTVDLLENSARPFLACPDCRSPRKHRHGHNAGLQRFRCIDCGRTYNSLTGTPMARLRHKARWLEYTECLLRSTTVRRAAEHLGVHRSTAFRWRHRFLTLPKTDRPLCLAGIAEADEMYFLESQKGARQLDRAPRRRGGAAKKRSISDEQVCVLVAREPSQAIPRMAGQISRRTHYLPNYLGWRWVLDAKRIISPESLFMATVGDFPHLSVT